jgi:hypothetical protein
MNGSGGLNRKGSTGYASALGGDGSPLFPPVHSTAQTAREALLHTLHRTPLELDIQRVRWTLDLFRETCSWLQVGSSGALWNLLYRLKISYKRARNYIHSPDPEYDAKRQWIQELLRQIRAEHAQGQTERVFLYQDELSYYRQPTLAAAYHEQDNDQPRARRSYQSDTLTRCAAALNALDGRVSYLQASRLSVGRLVNFYRQLGEQYPKARTIYLIQDNWSVHFHPDVLVALEPQEKTWTRYVPNNWSTEPTAKAIRRWGHLQLPIQLTPLPTYASWCNPIEKLWRKLKQEILHLHRWADELKELRLQVTQFLDGFASPSPGLLHYVGLLPDG